MFFIMYITVFIVINDMLFPMDTAAGCAYISVVHEEFSDYCWHTCTTSHGSSEETH